MVRTQGLVKLARTEDDGAHGTGNSGQDVDDVAAGEVQHAPPPQNAVWVPVHVGDRAVHEAMPEKEKDQHRVKLHALREGARCDASRDDGKGELKHQEDLETGHTQRFAKASASPRQRQSVAQTARNKNRGLQSTRDRLADDVDGRARGMPGGDTDSGMVPTMDSGQTRCLPSSSVEVFASPMYQNFSAPPMKRPSLPLPNARE